jgi:hypothetical protein
MPQGASINPPPLSYEPTIRRRRRTWTWAKRSLITLSLFAAVIAVWRFGPHARRFARIWYWQWECMHFSPPPGAVAYEKLPPGKPKPAIGPPYIDADDPQVIAVRTYVLPWGDPPPTSVSREPICWIRFLQASGNTTCGIEPSSLLYCHQLTSPTGHLRLVTIEKDFFDRNGNTLPDRLRAAVYPPAGWAGCVNVDPWNNRWVDGLWIEGPSRFFPGQPDPADASHFTIEYQWPDGVHGMIDGYLRDDEDVVMTVRPGPGDVKSELRRVLGRRGAP